MSTEQLSRSSLAPARTAVRRKPSFERSAAAPRRSRGVIFVARMLDVALAALFLCVSFIPMLVIAALIRLTSHGPIIFKQERTGLDGRSFVIFKFRTMRLDAESETGPIWSKRGDPRCTRLGGMLRRYCLDELPQFVNVLRGEMSLVGPRPERPFFVQAFSRDYPEYTERLQVLPGITGWAQVNGWRGDSSLEKRLEFDLYYVRHWSLLFNLRILLQTPFRMLFE